MNTATITEAKNRLSALIDRVRSGESILILDRGVPVARLEPVAAFPDSTGRLRRLERAGVIRVGDGSLPSICCARPRRHWRPAPAWLRRSSLSGDPDGEVLGQLGPRAHPRGRADEHGRDAGV